jgi:high-affinity Fe2+/Pb2+ permease
MSSAFIQAAVILLREGLEAMLVIAALAGYLTKAGAGHRIQALYGGVLAAQRIPLRPLFIITSAFLLALATYSVVQRNSRLAREDKAAMRAAKP